MATRRIASASASRAPRSVSASSDRMRAFEPRSPLSASARAVPRGPGGMRYQSGSLEARLLSEDPAALDQVGRWVAEVITSTRFWDLREDWADLHQEILIRVIGSLRAEHFDPSKDLKAYAQAVARYTALRSLASRRRFFLVGGRGRPEPREPRSAEDDAILGQLVRKALESLGDECRRMIMAYFLQERTYAELAVELGVPVGTVKSRLFRCLKRAHAILSGRGRAAALQREVT